MIVVAVVVSIVYCNIVCFQLTQMLISPKESSVLLAAWANSETAVLAFALRQLICSVVLFVVLDTWEPIELSLFSQRVSFRSFPSFWQCWVNCLLKYRVRGCFIAQQINTYLFVSSCFDLYILNICRLFWEAMESVLLDIVEPTSPLLWTCAVNVSQLKPCF